MGTSVGLDVSLKETSVCILDQDGTRADSSAGAIQGHEQAKRTHPQLLFEGDSAIWRRNTVSQMKSKIALSFRKAVRQYPAFQTDIMTMP